MLVEDTQALWMGSSKIKAQDQSQGHVVFFKEKNT